MTRSIHDDLDDVLISEILKYLLTKEVLKLRSVSFRLMDIMTNSTYLSQFRSNCLHELLLVRKPPKHDLNHWNYYQIAENIHIIWLLNVSTTQLVLGECPYIGDPTFHAIGDKCPNLKCFGLSRSSNDLRLTMQMHLSTLSVVYMIERCSVLHRLNLAWCSIDGDIVCTAISKNAIVTAIEYLNLDGIHVGNLGISSLSVCVKLKELFIRDCIADDVSPLASCPLQVLHLCRGYFTQESLLLCCKGISETIEELCIAGNREIETPAAVEVLQICPNLKKFNCERGTSVNIRDNSLRELVSNRKIATDACF